MCLRNQRIKGYLVSKAHTNKIPTAIPILSGLTFSMATIVKSPGIAVKQEINMMDKKVILVWQVLLTSWRCRTVILCFRRPGRHRSYINTVRIYCKSVFQDGDHKPEVLSVLHITFTAFACKTMLDSVWLWCFSAAILKCDIEMTCCLNDQENITID